VSWSAVTGASSYMLTRSTTSGGTYTYATTTTGLSATVTRATAATNEWVKVTAVNVAGGGTASTAVEAAYVVTADTTAPTTPGTPTATATSTGASVAFTASTDNVAVAGYRVYSSADAFAAPIATGTASPISVSLASGSYTLKVSAYDAAGNESALSAASNAVSPIALFVRDTFTGAVSTAITARSPEVGGAWSTVGWAFQNTFRIRTSAGQAYPTNGVDLAINLATPPSADYTVAADVTWVSPFPSGQVASLYSRAQISTDGKYTYYELRWAGSTNTLTLLRYFEVVGGSGTQVTLGTFTLAPTNMVAVRLSLSTIGTSITAAVNGVTRITATDSAVTAAGYPGFGTNGWYVDTSGAGAYFDNFTAG
jgi:hypothetical protein